MQALVELIKEDDLKIKATFPRKVEIREIAAHIAARVFEQAIEENLKVKTSSVMPGLNILFGDIISFLTGIFISFLTRGGLRLLFSLLDFYVLPQKLIYAPFPSLQAGRRITI